MSKTNGEQNSLGNFEERNNTFLDSFEEKDYKIDNVFEKYKTFRQRLDEFHKLEQNKLKFSNDIYLIGFGSVGRVLTHILQRLIDFNHLFIFERRELDKSEKDIIFKSNVTIIKTKVTRDNYLHFFKNVKRNDLIVDCAIEIDTLDIIKFCQERSANHINSCIQDWDCKNLDSIDYSLCGKHLKLDQYNNTIKDKNFNCIVSCGCNPGNVSLWMKIGLLKIREEKEKNSVYNLEQKRSWEDTKEFFSNLSEKLGVQTIHISERDTQISNRPKNINEYCNTWSMTGEAYFEESLGCCEASLGTHETIKLTNTIDIFPNYLIWKKRGCYVEARSYVPIVGSFVGNVIRHDESFTIGRYLTKKQSKDNEINYKNIDNKEPIIYKPSVYYVYHPSDFAKLSLEEMKSRNNFIQDNYRIMSDDIIDGADILGLTFYLKDSSVYWCGSVLLIEEAINLLQDEVIKKYVNATNLQVIAGYLSGITQLIQMEEKVGLITPEEMNYDNFIKYSIPFLGDFIFEKVEGFSLKNNLTFYENEEDVNTNWKFENFLVN